MDGIELVPGVTTGEYAGQRRVRDDQGLGLDPGPGPACESDGQQPPVASQGRRRLFGHGPANGVIDGINPVVACQLS